MSEFDYSVAEAQGMPPEATEQSADDAQTAAETTADQVLNSLLVQGEPAEKSGDGDQTQGAGRGSEDKFGNRMRAALSSQKAKFQPDIDFAGRVRGIAQGMTDDEIADALTSHFARKMSEDDSSYSEKSAREIIELRAKAKANAEPQGADVEAYKAGIASLQEMGVTNEELLGFASDEQVRQDLADGKTLTQAYMMYMRRGAKPPEKRRGVPTFHTASTAAPGEHNAIEEMSDEEFEAFDRKLRQGALEGKKYRL